MTMMVNQPCLKNKGLTVDALMGNVTVDLTFKDDSKGKSRFGVFLNEDTKNNVFVGYELCALVLGIQTPGNSNMV